MNRIKHWKALNWPNRISILRLLMVLPFIVLLLNQHTWGDVARHLALVVFVIVAVSDFIDGFLARRLNIKPRLGAILDPLADKVLIICSTVLLSLPDSAVPGHQLPNWLVVVIVGKDLWVILGFVVIYLVTDRFRVLPTKAGKASTAAQLVMVCLVLLAPELDKLAPGLGAGSTRVLIWTVAVLCAAAVISYTRLGLSFVAEGQKPLDDLNHNGKRQPHEVQEQ